MARGRPYRLDAAIIVLRSRGEPMTSSEIVHAGALNGLFERGDHSMAASVNTALYNAARRQHSAVVSLGNGRYGLREWGSSSDTSWAPPHQRAGQFVDARSNDAMVNKLTQRLREVFGYLEGLTDLSADRVCLLIEFCYLLELDRQAVDLHLKLPKDDVDSEWLRRVERLVRVCRNRLGD